MIKLKNLLLEQMDLDAANKLKEMLNKQIKAPFVRATISTLGGKERPSVMLAISMDEKNTWQNNIFENSRYARFHITHDGVIELFSGWKLPKFRKSRFKNIEDVVKKINLFVQKASSMSENIIAEASRDSDILELVSSAFDYPIEQPDVRYIIFKPRKHMIVMQDKGGRFHNIHTHISADEAKRVGLSLQDVAKWLSGHGATQKVGRMQP